MGRPSQKVGQRTREGFRALRELVGMSRAMLAYKLEVQERSVNRWEKPSEDGYYNPPQDAWDILDRARNKQLVFIETALAEARKQEERVVRLNYWLTKRSFKENNPNETELDWQMSNANLRLLANELELEGFKVEFIEL